MSRNACVRTLPDEVVRKVAAEADLAVGLDLREVPRDRAHLVAEGLVEVGEVLRDASGRNVRNERRPRTPEARVDETAAAQSPSGAGRARSSALPGSRPRMPSRTRTPSRTSPSTPRSSRITRSYSAPTLSGMNQRRPTLIVSSGRWRSASTAAPMASRFSSVTGRIAITIGSVRDQASSASARWRGSPLRPSRSCRNVPGSGRGRPAARRSRRRSSRCRSRRAPGRGLRAVPRW